MRPAGVHSWLHQMMGGQVSQQGGMGGGAVTLPQAVSQAGALTGSCCRPSLFALITNTGSEGKAARRSVTGEHEQETTMKMSPTYRQTSWGLSGCY